MTKPARSLVLAAVLGVGSAVVVGPARASSTYPTVSCVVGKLAEAADACSDTYEAFAAWTKKPDDARRAHALEKIRKHLASAWTKLESKATKKGADCTDTTLSSSAMGAFIAAAVQGVTDHVTSGLDLTHEKSHRKCAAKVLGRAAGTCAHLLDAEADYLKRLAKDPGGTRRDAVLAKVIQRFKSGFAGAVRHDCPTDATAADTAVQVQGVHADVLDNLTNSPNVPTAWTKVTPPDEVPYLGRTYRPICSRGTPYEYFVKRGTVNKLLVYYQGGGACFDYLTCSPAIGAFTDTATDADNPGNSTTGFSDLTNPANPFKDWNAVFVTYCTGDVHWGDATVTYTNGTDSFPIEHRGFVNARVVEKFAREHFVNPERVFVTGSSAGAYGAIMGGVYLKELVYPTSRFDVLGDAGNGVVTQQFLTDNIQNWGVAANLPTWIETLNKPIDQLSIDQLWAGAATHYPDDRFAQYSSAYDGGAGSQSFFYNVMVNVGNPLAWLSWWNVTCDWNSHMLALAHSTAAGASNYRYYVGAGSRHTMWGSNKVYTDTKGGVPHIADWLADMLADDPGWTNVACTDCSLLPGICSGASDNPGATCQDDVDCPNGTCGGEDTRPIPLAAPFGLGGTVTCP